MKIESSGIATVAAPVSPVPSAAPAAESGRPAAAGLAWGALGVLAFSFTLPFTRYAVSHGLSASFIAYGRSVPPALIGAVLLRTTRQRRPAGRQWLSVAVIAAGVCVGFPILSALALRSVPSSHAAVVIGLLPLSTAVLSVLRTGERPGLLFWSAGVVGAVAVLTFVGLSGGTASAATGMGSGDLYLLGAVLCAAAGYTEGGLLSRQLGSWQTICWGLVAALPVMLILTGLALPGVVHAGGAVPVAAWFCFGYLSLVSMLLGFVAWYRGLAIGPVVTVSQVQLLQPILTICWSALLLGERPGLIVAAAALVVLVAVATAARARIATANPALAER